MKRLWYAVFSLALPLTIHAQVVLHGTVVDQQTGDPLAGASVTITGTTTTVATNDSGKFTLVSPSAINSVTAARVGYSPKIIGSPTDGVRIDLPVAQVELPGVHVTATTPQPSTAVLTKSDLNRNDGINLSDALNTIPGVFMQSRTPFGGAHINIRGYYPSFGGNSPNSNGAGYSLFLNNIPITDATGVTVMDDIDYSTLGSVQVIKGPSSSLYGGFIGGTVNLTSARPTPDQSSFEEQFLGGGDGLQRDNTRLQGSSDNSDYILNYGEQQDNSFRPHSQSRKTYATAIGDFGVSAKQTLSAFFSYNRSLEDLAGEIDSSDYYARRPVSDSFYVSNNSHIQLTSFFTGLTDNYQLNDHFSNQTTVFGSSRFTDQPIAHGYTDATQFNGGGRTAFMYTGGIGSDVNVKGTLGGMLQRSNVTSDGASIGHTAPYAETPSASENLAQNSYLFTEWNFALPAELTATVGGDLIYDIWQVHNLLVNKQIVDTIPATQWLTKHFKPTLAPRASLTKGIGTSGSVYASWGEGFAPPLLSTITASNGTVNTNLKPEKANQYEIGAQGNLLPRLGGQLSLYDLINTDKLITQSVGGVNSTTNVGKQEDKGAELSLSYLALSDTSMMVSTVRPWVSYTYTDAKYVSFYSDNNNTSSTVNYSGNQVARIPKTMYSAGIDAATRMGLYLTTTYQYVGKVPVTFDNSTWVRSYTLLDAKIGYKATISSRWKFDVFAGANNLSNSTNYTFLFVGPNYAGLAQGPDGGSGDGYILPGNPKAVYYGNINFSYIISK